MTRSPYARRKAHLELCERTYAYLVEHPGARWGELWQTLTPPGCTS